MLPQQFRTDFHSKSPQSVDQGYSTEFHQNAEPGPSTSTSHSPSGQPSDSDSLMLRRSAQRPKRKRIANDNPDNSPESGSASINGSQRSVYKKKKANRACFHCQKAHLTCDDSRPCQRCIKRGLADKCTEGLRKKAKYLLDDQELAALKQQKSRQLTDSVKDSTGPPPSESHHSLDPPDPVPTDSHPDPLFNLVFDQAYTFGSEAANLEYSILSAILGNPSPPDENSNLSNLPEADASGSIGVAYPQFANPDWPAPPPQVPSRASSTITPSFLQHQQQQYGESPTYQPPPQPQNFNTLSPTFPQASSSTATGSQSGDAAIHQPQAQMYYSAPSWDTRNSSTQATADPSAPVRPGTSYLRTAAPGQPQATPYQPSNETPLQVVMPPGHNQSQPPGQNPSYRPNRSQGLAPISPPPSNSSPGTPLAGEGGGLQFHLDGQGPVQRLAPTRRHQTPSWGCSYGPTEATPCSAKGYTDATSGGTKAKSNGHAQHGSEASSVYNAVTKRYDYTEGYHFLMRHLHARFDKNDILRVVRALAIVRPSLIALQMLLTDEDEVFVEKCLQRSLIELDKLISFGGTPTVVWRRTGEICLVGFEFTMLTEWTRNELLGKRKYIYELFENQSTVEYFEKFAAHAFENTTQSVISHCVLLKPSGAPVPCAFCFSIRRDIFDLPNMIIGQWLPLL